MTEGLLVAINNDSSDRLVLKEGVTGIFDVFLFALEELSNDDEV
jgi:hypothetical protein